MCRVFNNRFRQGGTLSTPLFASALSPTLSFPSGEVSGP